MTPRSTSQAATSSTFFVDLAPGHAVDDPGLARVRGDDRGELRLLVGPEHDAILDVRAVEAGDEQRGVVEHELALDVAAGRRVRGRRQGDARHAREALVQQRELAIVGPEIVAPLRDAMRLVDREQGDRAAAQQVEEARHGQALGCDVEQVERAGGEVALGVVDRRPVQVRVQRRGAHAELAQRCDLILHQRDQRRDHDGDAGPAQRRHLVAHRLAAAGRHQDQGVAAGDHVVDDRRLVAAECVVAEHLLEDRAGGRRLGFGCGLKRGLGRAGDARLGHGAPETQGWDGGRQTGDDTRSRRRWSASM